VAADLSTDDDLIASINVTPFVDVVLVLLVILMVTSTQIVRAALNMELPTAKSAGEAVPTTLNLVLDADGKLFANGISTSLDELIPEVRRIAQEDPKTQAVIAADHRVPYGEVVKLIDAIKSNGLATFALNVERQNSASPPPSGS
jgi:biopolymer transport protein ExbD